jgi:hypothetical protein
MTLASISPTVSSSNPLTAATVQAATSYVDTDAWAERMENWAQGYGALVRQSVLNQIAKGAGPKAVASHLRQYAENVPVSAAESLTRTLQLTSYRDASAAMERVNGDFIEYKIRVAKLDGDTCLACIAEHGTRLEVGERVDDHYNGRCSELYKIPGAELPAFMQADSTPGNRNFVAFQTGPEWFASLPPERQALQAAFQNSPALQAAYSSGVPLTEFVGEYIDPIFGRQVVQQSLVGALGEEAAKGFYK